MRNGKPNARSLHLELIDIVTLQRIVSGGQTGADRAALDAARDLGFPYGGWIPKGRRDEYGTIPDGYGDLLEADDEIPATRTALNVRDSDATLILSHGALVDGSELTAAKAGELAKPYLHVDFAQLSEPEALIKAREWVADIRPGVLNVAGPRESDDPEIYDKTKRLLEALIMDTGNRGVSKTDLLTIALARRDAALSDVRHWDQIRWLVPYWFCVLSTAVAALVGHFEDVVLLRAVSLALGMFGILCLILILNLGRYHNHTLRKYDEWLALLTLDAEMLKALKSDRPFLLTGWRILRTATFWFALYIAVITGVFMYTAWSGVWWR